MSLASSGEGTRAEATGAILDFLCAIPMFNGLKTSELKIIAEHMNCFEVDEGDVVFLEGERGDYVCYVAEGSLEVTKNSPAGTRVVLTALSQGQSIGEMAVIDDAPRSATVIARTRARLLTLTRQDFDAILQQNPVIGISLLKGIARILSLNLRRTSGQLAERMLPVM
ncbi:MAG TPA: cyclic nucleotide-binding domain-containing protein [Candidatus Acidoferrum sp.]|nr:cyclic nucleotide-binding domain-containing protein [Candidatus Acidoferrum sp.]